ncbi:MAG: succinate dehydrogenase/fumarate reductase iron-sulfur subunit [Desulfovermiculus sp.]|nr:succinate dehydrogenase/fumarate reductase iron-sulfur subunit [Desulfovermiculus sp.]
MSRSYTLNLHILRFDPDSGNQWFQDYQISVGPILRFVDVLRKINDEQDPSLAWNSSCEHGQCGTCSIKVNGKPLLACELLVENAINYFGTPDFTIEPIDIAPTARDLVFDIEHAYTRVHKAEPYIIDPAPTPEEEDYSKVSPKEQEKYVEATRCINCFCCATACISSHKNFIGPNAAMSSIVRLMDSREQAKEHRLKLLYSEEGIYRCHTSKACSHVCPKEIDVAHFIALAKQGDF